MNIFKEYINENQGLRFVYDKMNICSSAGRKHLLSQSFRTDEFDLQMELDILEEFVNFVSCKENSKCVDLVSRRLSQLNDIHQTIQNLKSGQTLDDIELFEIKNFAINSNEIWKSLSLSGLDILPYHDLQEVICILDPENNGIPSFYVYSVYDEKLARLRKEYDEAKLNGQNEKAERLRLEAIEIEDSIRFSLSEKLRKFGEEIGDNYRQLAKLDVFMAKAVLARDFNFCKPSISRQETSLRGAFNPVVADSLSNRKAKFQPVDISFGNSPVLITGANMSGKTVVLKTVSLVQILFQFGFYVPCESAEIVMVEEVMHSIGDAQSEVNGLSSFAIEMLNIDSIINAAKSGKRILALVDELARTTNPSEGRGIVNAFIKIMTKYNTMSLATTHYNGILTDCKRLRVKGLVVEEGVKITPENINNYMDYSLVETSDTEVPTEGLSIARIFGVDAEFLEEAEKFVK
ncbi:MAG: DNA mismatch repair protein MutS [Bacteroidales bacterium]|nr:DNA mismatch repair protein MutS [Bacteroidales bacterium]